MNTNITINDINKVRAQALRWTKRIKESKLLKWESLPYYCMRIGRCMRKLGLQYTVIELTDCEGREAVLLSLDYTEDELPFKSVAFESQPLYRDQTDSRINGLTLTCMIVSVCQQLADYLYERPTPQLPRRE